MSDARDLTGLVERVALRLMAEAVPHPVSAALARAIHGRLALDVHQFAALVGLPPGMIDACERGAVAFAALPDALVDRVDHIDLLALADLDRACRPPVIRAG